MKDIFMVRLDWSTTDADGIDTELYEDYNEAYDGLVHNVEEPEEDDDPAFDMSAYDAEALAKLDEIFGNVLELR